MLGQMREDHLFFFNDTATTEIYTLSLHDALPILFMIMGVVLLALVGLGARRWIYGLSHVSSEDRKSTRLNSSHLVISYAVFCLKKKRRTQRSRLTSKQRHAARPAAPRLDCHPLLE